MAIFEVGRGFASKEHDLRVYITWDSKAGDLIVHTQDYGGTTIDHLIINTELDSMKKIFGDDPLEAIKEHTKTSSNMFTARWIERKIFAAKYGKHDKSINPVVMKWCSCPCDKCKIRYDEDGNYIKDEN